MNREILFKAKRIDKGEWVEGCLIIDYITGQYFIHQYGSSVNESQKVGEDGCLQFGAFEIEYDTLCQYTGLKDKNAQKIWENDIVKTNQYGVDKGDGRNFSGFDTFHVSFSEGSFCLMNKWRRFNLRPSKDLEVVGNIFDNPELLEGER